MARESTPELPPKPVETRISIENTEDGLNITAKPLGVVAGSYGLCILGPIIAFVPMWYAYRVTSVGGEVPLWGRYLITAIGGLGLLLTLFAFDLGKATTHIALSQGKLTLTRAGLLLKRSATLALDDIRDLGVNEAAFTAGNKTIYRLEVHAQGRKPVTRLTGRSEHELHWVAAHLRAALTEQGHALESNADSSNP